MTESFLCATSPLAPFCKATRIPSHPGNKLESFLEQSYPKNRPLGQELPPEMSLCTAIAIPGQGGMHVAILLWLFSPFSTVKVDFRNRGLGEPLGLGDFHILWFDLECQRGYTLLPQFLSLSRDENMILRRFQDCIQISQSFS